jgi:hypothetical protein
MEWQGQQVKVERNEKRFKMFGMETILKKLNNPMW